MATEKPKRPRKPALSAREVRFCRSYAETGNGYQSYLAAGFPEKASRNATDQAVKKLFRKAQIQACIHDLQQAAADAALCTIEVLAQALRRIALGDRRGVYDSKGRVRPPDQWPPEVVAAFEGADSEELFETTRGADGKGKRRQLKGYARSVKFARRMDALRLLCQWQRMVGSDETANKPPPPPLVVGGEANPDLL